MLPLTSSCRDVAPQLKARAALLWRAQSNRQSKRSGNCAGVPRGSADTPVCGCSPLCCARLRRPAPETPHSLGAAVPSAAARLRAALLCVCPPCCCCTTTNERTFPNNAPPYAKRFAPCTARALRPRYAATAARRRRVWTANTSAGASLGRLRWAPNTPSARLARRAAPLCMPLSMDAEVESFARVIAPVPLLEKCECKHPLCCINRQPSQHHNCSNTFERNRNRNRNRKPRPRFETRLPQCSK